MSNLPSATPYAGSIPTPAPTPVMTPLPSNAIPTGPKGWKPSAAQSQARLNIPTPSLPPPIELSEEEQQREIEKGLEREKEREELNRDREEKRRMMLVARWLPKPALKVFPTADELEVRYILVFTLCLLSRADFIFWFIRCFFSRYNDFALIV